MHTGIQPQILNQLFPASVQQASEYNTIIWVSYTTLHVFLFAQVVGASATISGCFSTISVARDCISGG